MGGLDYHQKHNDDSGENWKQLKGPRYILGPYVFFFSFIFYSTKKTNTGNGPRDVVVTSLGPQVFFFHHFLFLVTNNFFRYLFINDDDLRMAGGKEKLQ
jgi:hypothetical protein